MRIGEDPHLALITGNHSRFGLGIKNKILTIILNIFVSCMFYVHWEFDRRNREGILLSKNLLGSGYRKLFRPQYIGFWGLTHWSNSGQTEFLSDGCNRSKLFENIWRRNGNWNWTINSHSNIFLTILLSKVFFQSFNYINLQMTIVKRNCKQSDSLW